MTSCGGTMRTACVGKAWPLLLLCVALIACVTVRALTCEELQCQNSNPCQSSVSRHNHTHARCVCGGKWAGRRCEHLILVTPTVVTSSHVTLNVGFASASKTMTSEDGSSALSLVSPEEGDAIELNYTLVFWKKNMSSPVFGADSSLLSSATKGAVTCVLLHGRQSRTPTVGGLLPRTRYTICVENGFVDSCYLSSFADPSSSASSSISSNGRPASWPPNCVTIFTPSSHVTTVVITGSTTVTVVAAISTSVLVILIIVFILFLIRRQSVAFRLFLDEVLCCCGQCLRCCAAGKCNSEEDRTYLDHPSASGEFSRTYRFRGDSVTSEHGTFGRALLDRLRPGKRKRRREGRNNSSVLFTSSQLSSDGGDVNKTLLFSPALSLSAAFNNEASSPLNSAPEADKDASADHVTDSDHSEVTVALVTTPVCMAGGRCKPRHRVNRKRRGYVTYSVCSEHSARLTPVPEIETPVDESPTAEFAAEEAETAVDDVDDDLPTEVPPPIVDDHVDDVIHMNEDL